MDSRASRIRRFVETSRCGLAVLLVIVSLTTISTIAAADEPDIKPSVEAEAPLPGLKRLSPDADVWLDPERKQLILRGDVVLRRGPLELFACLKRTKEHEAIVSVATKAYVVHAGLLACGAQPGNPARFQPEFTPARGTEIEVLVEWVDAAGKTQKMDARQWIKSAKTGKAMDYPWVFGGSGFWTDPADGKRYYQAEDGDFICISNFPSAMLDVPVESSAANSALLFEAFTANIPPEKTRVTIYLIPKLDAKEKEAAPEKKPAGEAS